MTQSSCVVCGAVTDRFLCGSERANTGCLGLLLQRLGDCASLVDDLNTTLSRQSKMGGASIGFVSNGGDEQPLPLNLGATEAGFKLRDLLASWCRDLWETRHGYKLHCSACGVEQAVHAEGPSRVDRTWYEAIPTMSVENRIVPLSRWLMRHAGWVAVHKAADDLFNEITGELRNVRRAIDTAPGRLYIGVCSSVDEGTGVVCEEDLYVRQGEDFTRCRTCGVTSMVSERRDVLTKAVERQYVPVGLLVGLVTERGHRLTTSMLRNLKARGRIISYVRVRDDDDDVDDVPVDAYGFRVRPRKDDDTDRESLYLVGEVLEAITTKWQRQAS